MSIRLTLLAVISILSLSRDLIAQEVEVWGRTYDYSCGYFSRRATDLSFTLHDPSFPFGTEVNLIVGYAGSYPNGGASRPVSWEDRQVVQSRAINSGSWEARVEDKSLHRRTEGRFLNAAQFLFEIRVPGRPVSYVNGGSSWSYFQTENLEGNVPCVQSGVLPNWRRIGFSVVQK